MHGVQKNGLMTGGVGAIIVRLLAAAIDKGRMQGRHERESTQPDRRCRNFLGPAKQPLLHPKSDAIE